ncbi:hypothetical protein Anas_11596, partial [Armadillidium nasatum]
MKTCVFRLWIFTHMSKRKDGLNKKSVHCVTNQNKNNFAFRKVRGSLILLFSYKFNSKLDFGSIYCTHWIFRQYVLIGRVSAVDILLANESYNFPDVINTGKEYKRGQLSLSFPPKSPFLKIFNY